MSSTPHIFDAPLRRLRRARAAARCRAKGPSFFTQRCAEDTAERMLDIARQFEHALIIAPPDFWPCVEARLPREKIPARLAYCYDTAHLNAPMIAAEDDALPYEGQSFDLVISVLNLHDVNDLPGALMNLRHVLKPDGLMLSALFGGATLAELRQSFYTVETQQLGGLSPRVLPMIDFSQSASLLQRAGFALPVVDTDRFTLSYQTLSKLIEDLRDSAQTNVMVERQKTPLTRKFWLALEAELLASSPADNGRFQMTFEIVWMTGWAPHESQQKPLKPGSAKTRLADALGVKEQKL